MFVQSGTMLQENSYAIIKQGVCHEISKSLSHSNPQPGLHCLHVTSKQIIIYYKCVIQAVDKVWPDMQPVWLNKRGRE